MRALPAEIFLILHLPMLLLALAACLWFAAGVRRAARAPIVVVSPEILPDLLRRQERRASLQGTLRFHWAGLALSLALLWSVFGRDWLGHPVAVEFSPWWLLGGLFAGSVLGGLTYRAVATTETSNSATDHALWRSPRVFPFLVALTVLLEKANVAPTAAAWYFAAAGFFALSAILWPGRAALQTWLAACALPPEYPPDANFTSRGSRRQSAKQPAAA